MTLKKSEFIVKYGNEMYERHLERGRKAAREWQKAHLEKEKARLQKWREENPDRVKAHSRERCRKGGKRYDVKMEYQTTGIPGEKHKIRAKHAKQYRPYKRIIAPDSELHHEWIPKTAEYTGVALVEAKPHQYGIIDVIQILDGKITVLTEEEVRNGKKNEDEKEAETAVLLQ